MFMPQVPINNVMPRIHQGGEQDCHTELKDVVGDPSGNDLYCGEGAGEGDEQYHKTVDQL